MGLIKKITDKIENKKEERRIIKEIAKERLKIKAREQARQESFERKLDHRLPTRNIIKLKNYEGEVQYFLIDADPFAILLLLENGILCNLKFKRLTGKNAGKIYKEDKYATQLLGPIKALEQGYSIGFFDRNPKNGKLKVAIEGFKNEEIDRHFCEGTDLEKEYGDTISLRQILLLHKTDNRQKVEIDINNPEDYNNVQAYFNTADIIEEKRARRVSVANEEGTTV